jgi:hypothetical protein
MRVKTYTTQAAHIRKSVRRYKRQLAVLIAAQLARRKAQRLPYDDDPAWNASFAKSLDILQRMADKARKEHEEGRTTPLDPDKL